MGYAGRGDENEIAPCKLNDELSLMQYQMTAIQRVEVIKGPDDAPSVGEVGSVTVRVAHCLWAHVTRHGSKGKDVGDEVEVGIVRPIRIVAGLVPLVKVRSPGLPDVCVVIRLRS